MLRRDGESGEDGGDGFENGMIIRQMKSINNS